MMRAKIRALGLVLWWAGAIAAFIPAMGAEPGPAVPGESHRPRVVVTTDPELDDLNSLVRFLLHGTDYEIAGLVYASSQFHWKGDGRGTLWFVEGREYTRFGLDMGPMESWRWPEGPGHIEQVVDAYEQAFANLQRHDARYPEPAQLRSLIRDGNIEFDGEYSKDTPGSELIKALMLDDVPGPLYITAWGGQSTIARALKSIQDEFEGSAQWATIRDKIAGKVVLLVSGDQDDTGAQYIQPNWPELYPPGVLSGGLGLSYGAQSRAAEHNAHYYTADWMQRHVSGAGPLGNIYRVWGDGKGLVENDIFDYFGLSGLSDQQLRDQGYIVWTPVQPKGSWLAEGDTFTFLNLLDFGLRSRDDYGWGGVGGYRRLRADDEPAPGFLGDGTEARTAGPSYPDFLQVVQNEFATRLAWSVAGQYNEANHAPQVQVSGSLDIEARRGDWIELTGSAVDPDGDAVSLRWWQFETAGSYAHAVSVEDSGSGEARLQVPADAAAGQTIHLVLEASDDAELPLTRFVRAVIIVTE
jgi:hypothetical protein